MYNYKRERRGQLSALHLQPCHVWVGDQLIKTNTRHKLRRCKATRALVLGPHPDVPYHVIVNGWAWPRGDADGCPRL